MERFVEVSPGIRLWSEELGDPGGAPLLLVMGANASGLTWPEALLERLGARHRVIRYDHRDTGRSTWAFDTRPYAIAELAGDAVAVLEAYGIDRAHVVGMSMGGVLAQLLLLDHPERLLSATLMNTTALGSGLASGDGARQGDVSGAADPAGGAAPGDDGASAGGDAGEELPEVDPRLLALWGEMADARDREAEIDWRVRHWRLLAGDKLPFDADEFRRMEERVIEHSGRHDNVAAHARAAQDGLARGAELAGVTTPTLVIDAPRDPINPPPHAERLAAAIPGARLVTIPGMGHALSGAIVPPLADAILDHAARHPATV